MMTLLQGIYPPIATPFENQEIVFTHLAENIKKWNEFDLAGYVLLGSNGENVMLSDLESFQIVETAIKYIPENKEIIIGAGRESTQATIDFINQASHLGGNAALVVLPHYYKSQMNPKVIQDFFLAVADSSPLPIIIYNVPKFTGLEMSAESVANLAQHPNIIGMKDSSGNITFQQVLMGMNFQEFKLLTGSANTLMPSIAVGACGGILALANIAPQICLDIYQFTVQNKWDDARKLQQAVIRLNQLTTTEYGIGGLKYTMDQVGFFGGEPRSPLPLPNEEGKHEMQQELKKLSLLT
jgi:4-hydroxy-2-oxoglutarate aldolase